METKKKFKYYAFISYSHKDKKWANWLYRKLSAYRLPRIVKKSNRDLPRSLTPLFLDEYHLQAGKIRDNINKELDSSKNLIVICSPNIIEPNADGVNWIDYEVEHFSDSGKTNRIIPVLVEGDKSTSFCDTLKKLDVLAQDVPKHKEARVISNVVAGLLELDPDLLWRDEQRRRKKLMIVNSCLAALGIMFLSLLGLMYWDWNRTHIEYFTEAYEMFGVDIGKNPINVENLKSYPKGYRFEYQGYRILSKNESNELPDELKGSRKYIEWMPRNVFRKLRSVTCVASNNCSKAFPNQHYSDYLEPRDNEYVRRDYKYNEFDQVMAIGEKDSKNILRSVCKYERGSIKKCEVYRYDENGVNVIGDAYRMFVEFSANGKLSTCVKVLQDRSQEIRYFDEQENCIRTEYIGPSGGVGVDYNMVSITKSKYDEKRREVSREFYNQSTNRIICYTTKISGFTNEFDVAGKRMVQTFLDDQNMPCVNNNGILKTEVILNDDGLIGSIGYYGVSNIFLKGWSYKYDEENRKIAETNINEYLQPIEVGGVAYTTIKYADLVDCRREEYMFYDVKSVPCISSQGCVGYIKEFDHLGNENKFICIDANGKCTNNTMGWAIRCAEYDSARRQIRQYFLDRDKKLFAYEYEEFKALTSRKIIDLNVSYHGALANADFTFENYDKKLRIIKSGELIVKISWINEHNKLVKGELGWASIAFGYNGFGEMSAVGWLDEYDKPKGVPPSGVAIMQCWYDKKNNGRTVTIQFYDENKYLVENCGFASLYLEYDEKMNLMELSSKNKSGDPISFGDFAAEKIKIKHDVKKRVEEIRFLMQDGREYEAWDVKAVRIKIIYDEINNIKTVLAYDKHGREVPSMVTNDFRVVENMLKIFSFFRYSKNYLDLFDKIQKNQSLFNIEYNCIAIDRVVEGKQAESVGIRAGDILDEMKGWRMSDFSEVAKTNSTLALKNVSSVIYGLTNTVRTLKVYRKMPNQKWERLVFDFNPGLFGFQFGPIKLSDVDFQEMIKTK